MKDIADELAKLHVLKEKGALSQQEFDDLKARLLNEETASPSDAPDVPVLWNPQSASYWALVLTPAFGAFIHARNWETLGQYELAAEQRKWMVGNILTIIVCAVSALVGRVGLLSPASSKHSAIYITDLVLWAVLITYLGTAIGWYKEEAPKQIAYVSEKLGLNYRRREYLVPVLVGIIYVAAFVFAIHLSDELSRERSESAAAASP